MDSEFLLLADHPVLDFLNTVAIVDSEPKDFLTSDAEVLDWLERAGFPLNRAQPVAPGTLLSAAHQLRNIARRLIEDRKAGRMLDLDALNRFLAFASSHFELHANEPNAVKIVRNYKGNTAESLLGPLAEAIAELLATVSFELVRHCEGDGCVLWFYDRTKSHRRRWCSMAICGNRHKVSAFRARLHVEKLA